MSVDLANPKDTHLTHCTVGRHRLDDKNFMFFMVDGKPLCYNHLMEITGAMDVYYDRKNASVNAITRAYKLHAERRGEEQHMDSMRRKVGSRQPGFVYYLRVGEHIKIGYAIDVKTRMKAYPPNSELLAVHPGTREVEKQMHQQFGAYLDRGREWFKPGKSLMDHIAEAREKFGDPSKFAHRYRSHEARAPRSKGLVTRVF